MMMPEHGRRWLAGLLLSIAVSDVAVAQSACDRPDQPDVPNGYSAERYKMEAAQGEVESYADDIRDYLDCLQSEQAEATDELGDTGNEWESAVSNFNNR